MKNGQPIARSARYERFLELRGTASFNRENGFSRLKPQEIKQPAPRRAAQQFHHSSHITDRIERAMRVSKPLYGIDTYSELMDAIDGIPLTHLDDQKTRFAWIGTQQDKVLTVITRAFDAVPVGKFHITVNSLPVEEIYFQQKNTLVFYSRQARQVTRMAVGAQ